MRATKKQERRILSVWLPALAIERWAKLSGAKPEAAIVLTVEGTHGPVIHAVTRAAAERGALAGMRLTDARALDPGLVALAADLAGDEALVRRLAHWAGRWSPLIEIDGPDALRLDVTGVAHLFGGERGLIADVEERFAGMGLTARAAIAPTPGAAWALARYVPPPSRGREGAAQRRKGEGAGDLLPPLPNPSPARGEGLSLSARLAPLPVAALRLSPLSIRTLERLGLKTIGALAGIERRSLARRFRDSDNPLDALDRMLGRKPDPLTAIQSERPPRAILRLAEPVADPAAAPQALLILIPRLVAELEARKLGARQLSLAGFRVDGSTAVASVATAIASRDPAHLQRLLADKAEVLDPGFGFDAFALTADWAEPLGAAQESLVEEPSGTREIARLIDRLSVKLGASKVRRPRRVGSHLPERSSGWTAAVGPTPSPSPEGEGKHRPQRLLDRPEAIAVIYATPQGVPRRFVWRRAVHDIARVQGPERIAPEWWRQGSSARLRDYYQVEDAAGRRYWIFREGVIGDGRGGDRQGVAPEWYLHGLFG